MKFKFILLALLFTILINDIRAASWSCFSKATAELFLPGSGYLINANFLQASTWAAYRYSLALSGMSASKNSKNLPKPKVIEHKENEIEYIEFTYYRSQWIAEVTKVHFVYSGIITFWDLVKHNCKVNYDSYKIMAAPIAVNKWYNNFFALGFPLTALALGTLNRSDKKGTVIVYNLHGIKQSEFDRDNVIRYYFTGIAEELVFRDLIQAGFYNLYSNSLNLSKKASWHAGVFSAAALFGLAHSGQGTSASAPIAFLAGLYLGYIYQGSPDSFNIDASIMAHSWYDIINYSAGKNRYKYFAGSKVEFPKQIPVLSTSFMF